MALLWSHTETHGDQPTHYEVRTAGGTRRLYTNGAFHSQHHPGRLLGGGIWDLLTLPALFRQQPVDQVLLLGVGGGTAIHQYRKVCHTSFVTGIELNPMHIRIAEEFFDCQGKGIKLVCADACQWVTQQHDTFDVLIDDLFLDGEVDTIRANTLDTAWMKSMTHCLEDDGMIIQNHLDLEGARYVASQPWVKSQFATAILFATPQFENVILALYRTKTLMLAGRLQAAQHIRDLDAGAARRLNFQTQQLY
jgi:spermidine synthase